MWVLDYLDDIESDFSAIHGVWDINELSGSRFFKFAERLPAYRGVIRARLEVEADQEERGGSYEPQRPVQASSQRAEEVPSNVARAHTGFQGNGYDLPPVFGPKPTE